MYKITIALKETTMPPLVLMFKNEKSAADALNVVKNGDDFEVSDDFGQTFIAAGGNIAGILFDDMDQSGMVSIEIGLWQQRQQAKYTSMANADPALRSAALLRGNGLPVMSPMGGRN